jgi:hypothetical protein
MTPIEIIAAICAVSALIKFVVIYFKIDAWRDAAKFMIDRYQYLTGVYLVISAVLFYYLYQVLTVSQIFVGMMLGMCMFGLFLAQHPKMMRKWGHDMLSTGQNIFRKAWLAMLLWTVLSLWVLWELFL